MTSNYQLDTASSLKLRMLYPPFAEKLILVYDDFFTHFGKRLKLLEGLRSFFRQDELFNQGRTLPGKKVTNARGGQSFHQYGIAADSIFLGTDPYLEILKEGNPKAANDLWLGFSEICSKRGLTWGGSWGDLDHCELTYGLKIDEIHTVYQRREKISSDGVSAVWELFDKMEKTPSLSA